MVASASTRGGGRGLCSSAASGLILVALAGCTSLLGVDGEYRRGGAGGGDGGAPATSTGTSDVGSSIASAAGGAPATTSTTDAQSSVSSGGGGSGEGGDGGGFSELPACGSPMLVPSAHSAELGYELQGFRMAPLQPRVRHDAGRTSVAWQVQSISFLFRESLIASAVDLRNLTPFDVEPYVAVGSDAEGALALLGPANVVTVSAPEYPAVPLVDARPVSAQVARFLTTRGGQVEDVDWHVDKQTFGVFGPPRTFQCDAPALLAFVEHGEDAVAAVCPDGSLALINTESSTSVGAVRSMAAARSGAGDFVVVDRDDGVFLHRAERTPEQASWGAAIQLDDVGAPDEALRPAIAPLPTGVIVVWTRGSIGARTLAAARCTDAGCCDLGLDAALEPIATERWGPALGSGAAGSPMTLAFAGRNGTTYGVFAVDVDFVGAQE